MTEMGNPYTAGAAFIDGRIVPIADAKISVLDAGVTRSDITYDVVGVWDGAFFRLDDQLARFERSCEKLRMTLPMSRGELADTLAAVVRASGLRRSYVEVICSRGVPRWGTRDPRNFENQFYAFAVPYMWILQQGDTMDAVVVKSVRRIPSDSVDPTVKNFHWGDLTRAQFEAYDRGARYPILLAHDGSETEGPGFNVFAVIDGVVVTPDKGALEGVTRRAVLELATEAGFATRQASISESALRGADEIFATSTAGGVMPISSLDGSRIGNGSVGGITQRLLQDYWSAHSDPRFMTTIDYAASRA